MTMSEDGKIIPLRTDRRKPENEVARREIEDAKHTGDPIQYWIALADQLLKPKE
jgi:hypothetical protein